MVKTIKELLSEQPFFKDLKPEYVELIAGCGVNVNFKAGEFIIREGEKADKFFVIRQGKVAIEVFGAGRGTITIQTIEENEILGWSWLFPPYNWRFDARTLEPTRAIALDGKCLRDKCDKDHELAYELYRRFSHVLAQRLEWIRFQLMDVYGSSAKSAKAKTKSKK